MPDTVIQCRAVRSRLRPGTAPDIPESAFQSHYPERHVICTTAINSAGGCVCDSRSTIRDPLDFTKREPVQDVISLQIVRNKIVEIVRVYFKSK